MKSRRSNTPEEPVGTTGEDGSEFTSLLSGDEASIEDASNATSEAEPEAGPTGRVSGWRRVFRGNRTLWIVAVVAVVSLAAGLLVQRFVISPSEAAANSEPPAPGLVTAPVEFGALSNDVTIRADIGYADALEVTLTAGGSEGAAIVTGKVPAAGDVINAKTVLMEITGRPVIVLPGELPAYRSLRIGMSGPDVLQLKEALAAVGIGAGDVKSNVFDQAVADGIGALYQAVGYTPPAGEEGATEAYRAAEDSVTAAQQAVTAAEAERNRAGAGPTQAEIAGANTEVAQAEAAYAQAKRDKMPNTDIAAAKAVLDQARANRDALYGDKDTSAEQSAVDAAYEGLTRAQQDLETARQAIQPFLPVQEVQFLANLPRRVDTVNVKRGSELSGAALTVSGANVRLAGAAAEADAKLVKVGAAGSFDLDDGTTIAAKVVSVEPGNAGERWSIALEPGAMTPEQMTLAQGANVRVSIPVGSTDGDVLSVPLAALTAGPGGESRVEVVDSDPREGADAETHLVEVETGLSADGFVEVTPKDGELAEGDLVVIGE